MSRRPEDRGLPSQPDGPEPTSLAAALMQGFGLVQTGNHAAAKRVFAEILQQQPDNFDSLHVLGILALHDGEFEKGVALIREAIGIHPDLAEAHSNLAKGLRRLNRHGEALESYDRAILLKPGAADIHCDRGSALRDLERPEDALASYDRAIALKPDHAEAHSGRGNALQDLSRPAEALASLDRAIALKPGLAVAHYNRANVLRDLSRPAEALASYDHAIALKPDYARAYSNRGLALEELERPSEALESYAAAIALEPYHPDAHWNRGLCLLLSGRLAEGWREYEWRKADSGQPAIRSYPQPEWSGEQDLAGRTLFLHSEQGLGDTIQFCRYARLAEARGATVVLSVQDPLRRLLATLGPAIEIVGAQQRPADFDYHAPLLSLPLGFGTTLGNVPAEVPYLSAEPDRVEAWKHRLGDGGLKIGICWQGKTSAADKGRSFDVRELRGIAAIRGVRLISLQKHDGTEQLEDLPEGMDVETLGPEFDAGPQAFLDSAAVMQNLDLVITSDTAMAHLAGALGRPAWIALKRVPEWRWLLSGETSPWYPTLRLFRQETRGDWGSVFDAMAARLRSGRAG